MSLNKSEKIGILGTILVDAMVLLCLLFFGFEKPEPRFESEGLAVNFGNVDEAAGLFEPAGEMKTKEETAVLPEPEPAVQAEKNILTQKTNEQSVVLENKKEKEAEKNRQKEQQIQKEQDQKAASIRNQAANAFGSANGKGSSQGTSSTGKGNQGTPEGDPNSKNGKGGGAGYGHFSLNGRSLNGDLPHPSYSIQEEGVVVVRIVVGPKGNVVSSAISLQGTNTDNSTLRNAALQAAKQAKFNVIEGNQNQSGTITYRFHLK